LNDIYLCFIIFKVQKERVLFQAKLQLIYHHHVSCKWLHILFICSLTKVFVDFKQHCIFPGQYNVKEDLMHKTSTGASAAFKSTTERKMTSTPDLTPGPGFYNPYNARKEIRKGYKFQ
jgi:hypothetical protein